MNKDLIEIRQKYVEEIKRELLGPGSESLISDKQQEIISSSPEKRYSIGILFPQNKVIGSDNNEVMSESQEDTEYQPEVEDLDSYEEEDKKSNYSSNVNNEDTLDEEIGLALQNMPSSMGITFFAQGQSNLVKCNISFATYRKALPSDCAVSFIPENPDEYELPLQLQSYYTYDNVNRVLRLISKSSRRIKDLQDDLEKNGYVDTENLIQKLYDLNNIAYDGYVRIPHNLTIILDFSKNDYLDDNSNLDGTKAKVSAYRKKIREDIYSISIMLVNSAENEHDDCLFQSRISVPTDGNSFKFYNYSGIDNFDLLDEEEKSLELLYRNKHIYATGLGVATDWNIDEDGNGEVFSEYFPLKEVAKMNFSLPEDGGVDNCVLSMKFLSDLNTSVSREVKVQYLELFIDLYESWINGIESTVSTLPEKFKDIAMRNIRNCKTSFNRMQSGIETLKNDDLVWAAFELANRAMFMQRVHIKLPSKLSKPNIYDGDEDLISLLEDINYNTVDSKIEDYYSWRPFQLAFILLSINSIVDEKCKDREIVDLIWFPTGGGKTEAYLGLTAFTIFYRKLAYPNESNGTAIIMRYTLRLLTAQQFTRAATLICACEYIRRDSSLKKSKYRKYPLGNEKITIGLWIGNEHTPNSNNSAKENLDKLKNSNKTNLNYNKDRYNKFQLLKCPWCSTKLVKELEDGKLKGDFGYLLKGNKYFRFYCPQEDCDFNDELPIQVVDEELYKNPPTLLFATVDKFAMMPWNEKIASFFGINSTNRAPELIIQDELHLISGPLGTMVGLYETAIDYLCSSKGCKTKIIASTATIRKAKEQCAALYNREVTQFPAPGISADDSFFAREDVIDHENGKFGRLYVGLMPSGKTKATMEIRSIAALTQSIYAMNIPDECKDKYWTSTVYFNSLKELGKCTTLVEDDVKDAIRRIGVRKHVLWRRIGIPDELTSRVSTTDLNATLDKLEHVCYTKKSVGKPPYPSNVLLATNMISVGIDIPRLNVMLMVGQPKLTSEYIQASSRIGREFPGIAFVLYDGGKSRDRSHYEQFKPYHEAFYKFVEPTGATPFSEPARERAMHAVIVTILRYLNNNLINEDGAALFDSDDYEEQINSIKSFIIERNKQITDRINPNMDDNGIALGDEVDSIIEKWENLISQYDENKFYYGGKFMFKHPNSDEGRLLKVFNSDDKDDAFSTMNSMRSVDTALDGNVILSWKD